MAKKRLPAPASKDALPSGFLALLGDVKLRIQTAQTRAVAAVSAELVRLYWDIGRLIDERQQQEGWGASVTVETYCNVFRAIFEKTGHESHYRMMMGDAYPKNGAPEAIVT